MDTKPIPAFYCCYLLRSTVQRAFNYIGSTPNMLRRVKQHNGVSKGGAKRTSRNTLKPWEVTCIVHGFPSKIAALQFEWAWQHTHKSRHAKHDNESLLEAIDFRVSPKSGKLRKRKPTAQARSLTDRITNLHILLRARSFGRWPLSLRFFATDVFRAFNTIDGKMDSSLRDGIHIKLDANAVDHYDKVAQSSKPTALTELEAQQKLLLNGVENLDFGYSSMKAHVEKSRTVLARADNTCAVCAKHTGNSENILLVCAHNHCEAVTHLHCLSKHFIQASSSGTEGPMLPIEGSCPSCKKQTQWQTLVKELTLRARGEKDLEKLFKKPRAKKNAKSTNGEPILDEFKTIEEIEEDESDDFRELEEFEASVIQEALEANIPEVAAKDPNTKKKATSRKTTAGSRRANPTMSPPGRRRGRPRKDSVSSVTGWSDAEVLD